VCAGFPSVGQSLLLAHAFLTSQMAVEGLQVPMFPEPHGQVIGVLTQAPEQREQESMVQTFPSSQFFGAVEHCPLEQVETVHLSAATHFGV
jgi:hypothetical protein